MRYAERRTTYEYWNDPDYIAYMEDMEDGGEMTYEKGCEPEPDPAAGE